MVFLRWDVSSPKNAEKRIIYAILREKKYCREKECIFLVFFHQQMKIWKKNLKKSLFRQNFRLYSNCIYYTWKREFLCKVPLIHPKTLKNTSFMKFLRKKYIVAIFIVFLFIFLWKQWNKHKIIEKSTFSVKRNFFRVMAYIAFFLTKKRWSFLDEMLILLKNLERG